jgi:hypothetical protein
MQKYDEGAALELDHAHETRGRCRESLIFCILCGCSQEMCLKSPDALLGARHFGRQWPIVFIDANERVSLRSDIMTTILFQFSRKLKLSRFTIDVLTERLRNLRPPLLRAVDEWDRFVGRTYESLRACDQLYTELGEQLHVVETRDGGEFPTLIGRFEDLHRRIAESISTLNSFENGTPHAF